MNILVIGQGGREHAIVWKLAQSSVVEQIFVAPGNAGTSMVQKTQNCPIKVDNIPALIDFVKTNRINYTIVGPELPLALGIVDAFQLHDLLCLGPSQKAAQLESS